MNMSRWLSPMRLAAAFGIPLLVASIGVAEPASPHAKGLSRQASRGLAFAQLRCAGCHGLTANASSPNPEAPPFEAVVNAGQVTRSTLKAFLRDSHSYPQAMNFTVAPTEIDNLAEYMLTLKTVHYRRAISSSDRTREPKGSYEYMSHAPT
jgi:mono/diheme cytochrome c family protein